MVVALLENEANLADYEHALDGISTACTNSLDDG